MKNGIQNHYPADIKHGNRSIIASFLQIILTICLFVYWLRLLVYDLFLDKRGNLFLAFHFDMMCRLVLFPALPLSSLPILFGWHIIPLIHSNIRPLSELYAWQILSRLLLVVFSAIALRIIFSFVLPVLSPFGFLYFSLWFVLHYIADNTQRVRVSIQELAGVRSLCTGHSIQFLEEQQDRKFLYHKSNHYPYRRGIHPNIFTFHDRLLYQA